MIPTIVLSILIFAALGAVVFRSIRKRRKGQSGCSSGCGGCPQATLCGSSEASAHDHKH